tara:strand:+ start:216 stop:422 length:207 start_codon:yes stop_codon:yes gene_type:complete
MELILLVVCFVLVGTVGGLFMYLLDQDKIEPEPTSDTQRGNFWDAETKKFYKWDELMELKKQKENNND